MTGDRNEIDEIGQQKLDVLEDVIGQFDVDLRSLSNPDLVNHELMLRRLRSMVSGLELATLAACDQRKVSRHSVAASLPKLVSALDRSNPGPVGGRLKDGVFLSRCMPAVLAGLRAGEICDDHARLIARTVNRSFYRRLAADSEAMMLGWARTMIWTDFVAAMGAWSRVNDPRDPADVEANAFDDRSFSTMTFDSSGDLVVGTTRFIHDQIVEAIRPRYEELLKADWDEAKARLGEDATFTDLLRSVTQRWHDAFVFTLRAGSGLVDPDCVFATNMVIDDYSLEHEAACFAHRMSGEDEVEMPVREITEEMILAFRSETLTGAPVPPSVILEMALRGTIRTHVINAETGEVSTGRAKRFFTGNTRLGMIIRDRYCQGAGCTHPAARCEGDHRERWTRDGETLTTNGDMLCPACHRHKTMLEVYGIQPPDFVGSSHLQLAA